MTSSSITSCPHAYRKAGKETLHCHVQTERGGKWDFCKHQYFCMNTKQYELGKDTALCILRKNTQNK